MVVNPAGAVPIFDGGMPRIITANAAVGVTGGQLVYFSGGNNVVSSGAYSFDSADLQIIGVASGANFNGIVLTPGNTASGTASYVAVGIQGTYILPNSGSVFAGQVVEALADGVMVVGSYAAIAAGISENMSRSIGRSLTNGTSGTSLYSVVFINP